MHLISHAYNAAHDCVTTNMVYATSLHIISHTTQKKDFAYELPKDLAYKSKEGFRTMLVAHRALKRKNLAKIIDICYQLNSKMLNTELIMLAYRYIAIKHKMLGRYLLILEITIILEKSNVA